MVVFQINADSIPRLVARGREVAAQCRTAVLSGNCADVCANCPIAQSFPVVGEAHVDRYTAAAVGASAGVVRVVITNDDVELEGSRGRFVASPNPRGGVKLIPVGAAE